MTFKVHPNVIKGADMRLVSGADVSNIPFDKAATIFSSESGLSIANGGGGLSTFAADETSGLVGVASASVAASGTVLSVVFDEAVDASDYKSGFVLIVDDEEVEITSADIDGGDDTVVNLTVPVIMEDQVVTLNYAASNGYIFSGLSKVDSFVALSVANSSIQVAPTLLTAVLAADGVTLTLGFSENISGDAADGLTVEVDGDAVAISAASITDDQLEMTIPLTLDGAVVVVSYNATAGSLAADDNDIPVASFTDQAVTNNSAIVLPTLVSADVEADGVTLTLVFSENMAASDIDAGFTVDVDGTPVALSSPLLVDDTVTFTVPAVANGEVVTVSYDADVGTMVSDATGLAVESFADEPVTNNVAP